MQNFAPIYIAPCKILINVSGCNANAMATRLTAGL